ncbi:MAG: sugar ABC transporter permease [Lachnospiraceae bacterium]|nr:sugar ABC transporter permease [Lachnospiraceae bacterium]
MKKKTGRKIIKKDMIWAYIFILVPLGTFTIFTLYPVVSAFITSFYEYKPLGSTWVGLENYINSLNNSLFWKALKNTLVYTVITVPLLLILSFLVSVMVLPFRKRMQTFFKAVYYLPAIASGVALAFVWKWIFSPLSSGLLNRVMKIFGISAVNWMGSKKTAMGTLIAVAVFSGLGKNLIIYIAALLGIDSTYYEVADMDGASFFEKIRYVVWPLVKPTTVFLIITSIINGLQSFQTAYLMTGGGPDNETTMVGLLIWKRAFEYFDYGEACAQALMLAVLISIFSIAQLKLTSNDVEY